MEFNNYGGVEFIEFTKQLDNCGVDVKVVVLVNLKLIIAITHTLKHCHLIPSRIPFWHCRKISRQLNKCLFCYLHGFRRQLLFCYSRILNVYVFLFFLFLFSVRIINLNPSLTFFFWGALLTLVWIVVVFTWQRRIYSK